MTENPFTNSVIASVPDEFGYVWTMALNLDDLATAQFLANAPEVIDEVLRANVDEGALLLMTGIADLDDLNRAAWPSARVLDVSMGDAS